jgi:hypothetical protein
LPAYSGQERVLHCIHDKLAGQHSKRDRIARSNFEIFHLLLNLYVLARWKTSCDVIHHRTQYFRGFDAREIRTQPQLAMRRGYGLHTCSRCTECPRSLGALRSTLLHGEERRDQGQIVAHSMVYIREQCLGTQPFTLGNLHSAPELFGTLAHAMF